MTRACYVEHVHCERARGWSSMSREVRDMSRRLEANSQRFARKVESLDLLAKCASLIPGVGIRRKGICQTFLRLTETGVTPGR